MSTKKAFILFPHQLFRDVSLLRQADAVCLVEESLFFNQYAFHKHKLVLHRASMKYYEDYLQQQGIRVHYVEAMDKRCDIRKLLRHLQHDGTESIIFYDVCDHWLEGRIRETCRTIGINAEEVPTPLFINSKEDLRDYFGNSRKYFQTNFYIRQRKKLGILVDDKGDPSGGQWSYDAENRLKYPKGKKPPSVNYPEVNAFYAEAAEYVTRNYSRNPGSLSLQFTYPSTHLQAEAWLEQFLEMRFGEFGAFEDAIVEGENILHHSVLSPLMNIGLLLPMQIVRAALVHAEKREISINSLEGFIRQIIGWREFIRGVYVYKGVQERTRNYWSFQKKMPPSFYTGTTGIAPVDATIKVLLQTGYNHHIERLMILGNFMLLCEIDPDEVYRWFMEMYIDAYDWVMVPNVYGMSQFADGGLMATKPYISGSSYVLKMSNYKKGPWCAIWDALFWHFMNKQRSFFLSNPRLGMLIRTYDKMSEEKKSEISRISEDWGC